MKPITIVTSALLAGLFALTSACVSAPPITVADSRTALETQAAGEYPQLEAELAQAGLSPRGEAIPRELIAGGGERGGVYGEVTALYAKVESDAEWVDRMLVAGCIGEALDGLLQSTPKQCTADVEDAEMRRILGRANLHRQQIWGFIGAQRPGVGEEEIRRAWREQHLAAVVCDGLVQVDAERWEKKSC